MKLHHLLVAAALFASIGLSARAITLPVAEDTASTGATLTAGISAGGHLTKAAGKATTLKVAPNASAFIRFDAGPMLAGGVDPADVTGARLTLYFPTVKAAADLGVSLLTSDWTETVATNTDQPTMNAPFATIDGERVIAKAFMIVDVTAQVKAWLTTPSTDFGFAINAKDTANVTLGAKEGTGTGYPATLEIDTKVAITSLDGSVITAGSIGASKLASNLTLGGTTSGAFSGNGSALTDLSAASISGQLGSAQLASGLTLGGTTSGTFSGDGSGLTGLQASKLTGDLSFAQLGAASVIGNLAAGTAGEVFAVAVAGRYVYVAGGSSGLRIVDVSDPQDPVLIGDVPESAMGFGSATGVAVVGRYAYLANDIDGLRIIDISDPTNPMLKGYVPKSATGGTPVRSVAVGGQFAYLAVGAGGFWVIDASDPQNPLVKSSLSQGTLGDNSGDALDVAVAGSFAYLADSSALRIIDISNPNSPTLKSSVLESVMGNGLAADVAVVGMVAYLANGVDGLRIIDISDPNNPVLNGYLPESAMGNNSAVGVAPSGHFVCVANAGNFQVVDVSDPQNPVPKTSLSLFNLIVTVAGDFAYVGGGGTNGLTIIGLATARAANFAGDGSALTVDGQALTSAFPKTDEKLRMIRGVILTVGAQSNVTSGTGFTFTHPSAGIYNINYNTAFTDTPAVTVSPSTGAVNSVPVIAIVNPNGYGSTQVVFRNLSGSLLDPSLFSFIALGKP